jgi:hypothetical protein
LNGASGAIPRAAESSNSDDQRKPLPHTDIIVRVLLRIGLPAPRMVQTSSVERAPSSWDAALALTRTEFPAVCKWRIRDFDTYRSRALPRRHRKACIPTMQVRVHHALRRFPISSSPTNWPHPRCRSASEQILPRWHRRTVPLDRDQWIAAWRRYAQSTYAWAAPVGTGRVTTPRGQPANIRLQAGSARV